MPQLDSSTFSPQLIWLAISFVVLYILMAKVALPKIGEVLEARQRRIDDNLDRAASLKRNADTAIKTYEESIAKARADAQALIREANDTLAAEAAKHQEELTGRLAAEASAAEQRVAEAKAAALKELRGVAAEVARSATVKLSGLELEEEAIDRVVERVMKERS